LLLRLDPGWLIDQLLRMAEDGHLVAAKLQDPFNNAGLPR
jgi:hypothetical protein